MPQHHRLDNNAHNDLTTGKSGFVHRKEDVRVHEPDEYWPHMPETNYHHDLGADPNLHSPGPYHGDDLVTQQNSGEDVHDGGRIPDSYMYPDGEHTSDARKLKREYDAENAVPVRVIEQVTKERRITYEVMSILIAPGAGQRILGKDPTRLNVTLISNAAGAYLVPPNSLPSGLTIAQAAAQGFPITNTGNGLKLDTEDELWAYVGSDVAQPGAYVSMISHYLRNTDTLEEHYG